MDNKFGTVNFNGNTYTLTQNAYDKNYGTTIRYYASAVDADGNECLVTWVTSESWNLANELYNLQDSAECAKQYDDVLSDEGIARIAELSDMVLVSAEDESNACDWDCPIDVKLI